MKYRYLKKTIISAIFRRYFRYFELWFEQQDEAWLVTYQRDRTSTIGPKIRLLTEAWLVIGFVMVVL